MRQIGTMWCGALLLAAALAAWPAAAQDALHIGQVKTVTGDAFIVRGGQHLAAKPGDFVRESDVLETGPGGTIGVTFIDNSVFSTGPSSQVALERFHFDQGTLKGDMLAEMRKGTLTVVSGEITHTTPGAMKIKTPTAILGVRGTTFAVKVY